MSLDRTTLALCVDVLGPLVLHVDGDAVEVPGVRRRALLAMLALEAGRGVSADRLVDGLWPEEPPANAVQALYNHVSRLRGHLGTHAHRLERHAGGYRLQLEPDELDADAARRLARTVSLPETPPAIAAELARSALSLWRGPSLAEFRSLPALEIQSVGLDELRLQLVDDVVENRLALGDRTVAVDAAAAAAASPLRERTALLHVRALATDGRTADAMAAAQAFRRRLADETGLDPGPALAELEERVAAGTIAPPLPAAGPAPRRVTRPDSPMVGREHDREEIVRLLGGNAIVTLTGTGGVGKTRLALDVAADPGAALGAEAVFVDLAAVDRPQRVCAAVASTLGLRTTGEVTTDDVAEALVGRDLLLLLDNCEHLLDACRELLVTLRRVAPGVRVLATSRTTLHVPGEYVVRLQPLPVPRPASDLETLRRQPAVRAFVDHARRRRSDYELAASDADDLVEVLRTLDGLPLGIELAARQVAVMPISAVRARLDRALDLATGRGGPDRQRTLRATIDASYRLLGEDEQRLLRALSPFPGGVDLATVEVLAAEVEAPGDPVDLLHRLVDASLVFADAASARYRVLVCVRTFLIDEVLAHGDQAAVLARFLDRTLAVAVELGETMFGPDEPAKDQRLRAELDNLRAARDLAEAEGRDDVRVGITLALDEPSLWRDLRELWAWALELAVDDDLAGHPQRVELLGCAAEAARLVGELDLGQRLAQEALALSDEPDRTWRAWRALGAVAHFRGDFATAAQYWLRSGEGRPIVSGAYVASAALAVAYGGDPARARELLDRARAANARTGCVSHLAFESYVEGELLATTRPADAVPYYLEAIEGSRRAGSRFIEGVTSVSLASARTRIGDVAGAAEGFAYLIDYWRGTGQATQLWTTARNAAGLLSQVGHQETAALLLICADDAPEAAAVGPQIARHSGRTFTPLADLVDVIALAQLRAEAGRLGSGGVLDRAAAELRELAAGSA